MAVQAVPVPASGGHKKFWAIVIGGLGSLIFAAGLIVGQPASTSSAVKAPAVATKAAPAAPSQATQARAWFAAVAPALTAFGDASTATGKSDGTLADMRAKMGVALSTGQALQATLQAHKAPDGIALGAFNLEKAVDMAVLGISQSTQGIDTLDVAMMTRGTDTVTTAGALLRSATSDLTAEMAAL